MFTQKLITTNKWTLRACSPHDSKCFQLLISTPVKAEAYRISGFVCGRGASNSICFSCFYWSRSVFLLMFRKDCRSIFLHNSCFATWWSMLIRMKAAFMTEAATHSPLQYGMLHITVIILHVCCILTRIHQTSCIKHFLTYMFLSFSSSCYAATDFLFVQTRY